MFIFFFPHIPCERGRTFGLWAHHWGQKKDSRGKKLPVEKGPSLHVYSIPRCFCTMGTSHTIKRQSGRRQACRPVRRDPSRMHVCKKSSSFAGTMLAHFRAYLFAVSLSPLIFLPVIFQPPTSLNGKTAAAAGRGERERKANVSRG